MKIKQLIFHFSFKFFEEFDFNKNTRRRNEDLFSIPYSISPFYSDSDNVYNVLILFEFIVGTFIVYT